MEWMRDLFDTDGNPKTSGKELSRSQQLADVIKAMQPDFLGIVEGPNTLVNGSKTASAQMELWTQTFIPGSNYLGVHGFPSAGQQELCAIYNPDKVNVLFTPETKVEEGLTNHFYRTLPTDSSKSNINTIAHLLN